MRKLLEGSVSITIVVTVIASTYAFAFAAGGHMLNASIHDADAITREQYATDIKDIRDSLRDIRVAIHDLAQ